MPWQYEYLEKALIMSRKLYNIQHTEYSKELVAWIACMLSDSADHALKERANDRSIKIHRDDPERFRKEGLSLYEELYNSSKYPWFLYTFINSNLVFAERLITEKAYDKAMLYTDNAVRLAPKIGSDNNMNELLRVVFLAAAQINHALSENEKALTFINESLRCLTARSAQRSARKRWLTVRKKDLILPGMPRKFTTAKLWKGS